MKIELNNTLRILKRILLKKKKKIYNNNSNKLSPNKIHTHTRLINIDLHTEDTGNCQQYVSVETSAN